MGCEQRWGLLVLVLSVATASPSIAGPHTSPTIPNPLPPGMHASIALVDAGVLVEALVLRRHKGSLHGRRNLAELAQPPGQEASFAPRTVTADRRRHDRSCHVRR
jgi:hypothetical protein